MCQPTSAVSEAATARSGKTSSGESMPSRKNGNIMIWRKSATTAMVRAAKTLPAAFGLPARADAGADEARTLDTRDKAKGIRLGA